jgi:hypothetical protein
MTKEVIKELFKEEQKFEEIIEELNQWKKTFPNQTPQQVKSKLEKKFVQQSFKKDELTLSKKISEEIIKAYNSPSYLKSYYLKLMKPFQDWEIYGNEEQRQACRQNKNGLEEVIRFLTDKK